MNTTSFDRLDMTFAMNDYQRVAKTIDYIIDHASEQPSLNDIARAVHLSPWHFHRIFRKWAGVTPKEFLRYISLAHAKSLLLENRTLDETAFKTGLSGRSRLHDLFISIEGMTPGEFKNGGESLDIYYHTTESPFGTLLIAATSRGICNLHFVESGKSALDDITLAWPNAALKKGNNLHIDRAIDLFDRYANMDVQSAQHLEDIKLHIRGTDFQLKVWEALLKIPSGRLTSYGNLAESLGNPNASRAVGSAVGRNPVALLIPCHRVIRNSGVIGNYRWDSVRKQALIGWESSLAKTAGK